MLDLIFSLALTVILFFGGLTIILLLSWVALNAHPMIILGIVIFGGIWKLIHDEVKKVNRRK